MRDTGHGITSSDVVRDTTQENALRSVIFGACYRKLARNNALSMATQGIIMPLETEKRSICVTAIFYSYRDFSRLDHGGTAFF